MHSHWRHFLHVPCNQAVGARTARLAHFYVRKLRPGNLEVPWKVKGSVRTEEPVSSLWVLCSSETLQLYIQRGLQESRCPWWPTALSSCWAASVSTGESPFRLPESYFCWLSLSALSWSVFNSMYFFFPYLGESKRQIKGLKPQGQTWPCPIYL